MKAITSDELAAIFVAALATASFSVFPEARADPIFPPAHVSQTAEFRVATARAATFKSPG